MSVEAVAAGAVGLLAVLVPLQLAIRADVADLRRQVRADLGDLRREVADVRRELAALAGRLARVEGALGWRAPAAGGEPGDGDPEGRPA